MQTTTIQIEVPIINPQNIIEHEGKYDFKDLSNLNTTEHIFIKFRVHHHFTAGVDDDHETPEDVQGMYIVYSGRIYSIQLAQKFWWGRN